jgi:hypothetical protein
MVSIVPATIRVAGRIPRCSCSGTLTSIHLLTGKGIKGMDRIMAPEAEGKQKRFHKLRGLIFPSLLPDDGMHYEIVECLLIAAQLAP